jgi:CBS domain-containing protein
MQASDVMTQRVVTVEPDTALEEVVRMMLAYRISGLPVVEEGRVVGIVTEGDLLRRPETGTERRRRHWLELFESGETDAAEYVHSHGVTAGEVMTPRVMSVTETTPLEEIAELLESHGIKRVPVLRDGQLVGIVTRADMIRCLGCGLRDPARQSDALIRAGLLEELSRHATWAPLPAEVSVIVQDGVVHFWGRVRSPEQRKAMIVAAERVAGVRNVEDHMFEASDSDPLNRPNWPSPAPP